MIRLPTIRVDRVLLVAALLLAVLEVAFAVRAMQNGDLFDNPSGIYCALAKDLEAGSLYRPLMGPDGYGGTRYFPLQVVLIAAGAKLAGGDYVLGAHLVIWGSCALLVLAVAVLMRREGATRSVAFAAGVVALATHMGMLSIGSARGTILPLSLTIAGLALLTPFTEVPRRGRLVAAGLLFALAFSSKMTSVAAPAAACLAYWIAGHRRAAVTVGAASAAAGIGALVVAEVASGGRFFEILTACAASGADLRSVARGVPTFYRLAQATDPWMLTSLAFAVTALAIAGWKAWLTPPALTLGFVIAACVAIIAAPGVDGIHFLEVHAIAVVCIGCACARVEAIRSRAPAFVLPLVLLGIATYAFDEHQGLLGSKGRGLLAQRQNAVELYVRDTEAGTLLTDDPVLEVMAGRRPWVLDGFMLCHLQASRPEVHAAFERELAERRFRRVLLSLDPDTTQGTFVYSEVLFGGRFLELLRSGYERRATIDGYVVFEVKA